MIVLSEYKLTEEQVKEYKDKGYRVAYLWKDYEIGPKEAVGILLDTMYKATIELIEYLLFRKHNLILKYDGQTYKLNTLDDWKRTYQSEKDQIKTTTERHILYQIYLDKRAEYFEQLNAQKEQAKYNRVIEELYIDEEIPSEHEMQIFIDTWSKAYDVQIDFDNKQDVLLKYKVLKYYVDNNLDVSNRDTEPDIVYIGNENLFEDLVYNRDRQSEILSALGY